MRVYLAGPWKMREWVAEWAKQFEDRGIELTHDWWNHDVPDLNPLEMRVCAANDLFAVGEADCLVVFDGKVSEGKATELGLALAWKMPVIVLHADKGPFHNIFHYLPEIIHCYDPDEVWDHLLQISFEKRMRGENV